MKSMTRCALAAAMAACAAWSAPAQAESIKVGLSKLLSYPAVPIAIERGYFKEQGLDAELVIFDSAQPIAVAVAAGDADFGVAGVSASFFTLAAQGTLRLIGSSGIEQPGFYNITFLASNRAYDSGLKSLKDLPGHTLGITQIGTTLHYSLGLAAEKYGFDIKSVEVKPLQSTSNLIAALIGGQIDAGISPATPTLIPVEQDKFKRLAWVSDEIPGWTGSLVFTSTKNANERGDLVKRFLVAYRKAAKDFHDAFATADNKRKNGPTAPEVLAILSKFTGVAVGNADRAMPYLDPESRLNLDDINHHMAWYKSQNMMKGDVNAEELIDRRYAIMMPAAKY